MEAQTDEHTRLRLIARGLIMFVEGATPWQRLTLEQVHQARHWDAALQGMRLSGRWAVLWRRAYMLIGLLDTFQCVTPTSIERAAAVRPALARLTDTRALP